MVAVGRLPCPATSSDSAATIAGSAGWVPTARRTLRSSPAAGKTVAPGICRKNSFTGARLLEDQTAICGVAIENLMPRPVRYRATAS